MLEAIGFGWIGDKEHRSQLPFGDCFINRFLRLELEELAELPDFFRQRHLLKQRVSSLAHGLIVRRRDARTLRESERSASNGDYYRSDENSPRDHCGRSVGDYRFHVRPLKRTGHPIGIVRCEASRKNAAREKAGTSGEMK